MDNGKLTIIVIRGNCGLINHQAGRMIRVRHKAITSTQHWGDIQTPNSIIGNAIHRAQCLREGQCNQSQNHIAGNTQVL